MQGWSIPECLALNSGDGIYNDHTRVFQWNCNGHDDQQWEMQLEWTGDDGHNIYQVVNKQSGKCMETRDRNLVEGDQIDQVTCLSGNPYAYGALQQQLWEIHYVDPHNSSYKEMVPFLAAYYDHNYCLDVRGASLSDGTMVEQWTCNGGTNQQFAGAPLDDPI